MALSPSRGGGGFWDPLGEMNRMFDQVFGGLPRRQSEGQQQIAEWAPAVDVATKDGDLVIRAELPGVKQEDVDITLQHNVLTISGERKAEQQEEKGDGYYVRERRYGSFTRSLALPEGTDQSKIHARYENGVLEVTVQGAAPADTEPKKRIQIENL
jgi:HSP20 family protein